MAELHRPETPAAEPAATPPPPRDITPMRQPMVTSVGIILGFLLNFLANWATADGPRGTVMTTADHAVAGALLLAIGLMCAVLFRLLDIRAIGDHQESHYMLTYRLYAGSIIIAFTGIGLGLFL